MVRDTWSSSLLTILLVCLTLIMPKADSSKTGKPARDAETTREEDVSTSSRADSGMIGPAPLIPMHREILRQGRTTVTRPYVSTTGILRQSLQQLLARGSRESQQPYELSNQEPQPQPQASEFPQNSQPHPLPEWSHSRVQGLTLSAPGPSNADPSVSSDSAVGSNFIYLILTLILKLGICD